MSSKNIEATIIESKVNGSSNNSEVLCQNDILIPGGGMIVLFIAAGIMVLELILGLFFLFKFAFLILGLVYAFSQLLSLKSSRKYSNSYERYKESAMGLYNQGKERSMEKCIMQTMLTIYGLHLCILFPMFLAAFHFARNQEYHDIKIMNMLGLIVCVIVMMNIILRALFLIVANVFTIEHLNKENKISFYGVLLNYVLYLGILVYFSFILGKIFSIV
ncbi:MAG: hypothetical protein ACP5OG_03430 [Candidatus Nanoarchaeia archaeon]